MGVSVAGAVHAQRAASPNPRGAASLSHGAVARHAPRLVCDAPTCDFGERKIGEIFDHTFILKNTGEAPLHIKKIRATCGCTIPSLTVKTIMPGKSTPLRVKIDLTRRKGPQRKSVRIETNDPAQPIHHLWIKGTSITEVDLRPDFINFSKLDTSSTRRMTVQLISRKPDTVITNLTIGGRGIKATIATNGLGITVETVPPLPHGRLRATVNVHTTHPEQPVVNLPVVAYVTPPLTLVPRSLTMKATGPATVVRTILLRPGTVKEYDITSVDVPIDGIEGKVSTMSAGNYRIDIAGIPVSKSLNRRVVTITTTAPGMETITVPIHVVP